MSSPLLHSFCCPNSSFTIFENKSRTDVTSGVTFQAFNIICLVTSFIGICGAINQLWLRIPRCSGFVRTADSALLLLVQNNILGCLCFADLLAAAGVSVRSSVWLAGVLPLPDGGKLGSIVCILVTAWVQYFYTCTYLWTLMFAINIHYMARDPPCSRSYMWLYNVLTWPVAAVVCSVGLLPLYWPTLSSCVQNQKYLLPVYVSSYVPLLLIMVACGIIYARTTKYVVENSIAGYRALSDQEYKVVCHVREKFGSFVVVFCLCWMPNIISGILLLIPTAPSHIFIAVWELMAVLNPLQAFLNCLLYRRVSVHWPPLSDYQPSSSSIAAEPEEPQSVHPTVENGSASLLIFGDQ